MPIVVPTGSPPLEALRDESVFVMDAQRAASQDIRPIRLALVNLMPTKVTTETQLARALSNSPLQVSIDLIHMGSHVSANTSAEHLRRHYRTIDEVADQRYDAMIVTGAPVEQMPFEDVDYWPELQRVMDYAAEHVYSTMFLCWGAQAALYHYYGVEKTPLESKLFGVFEHEVVAESPLLRGFDRYFDAPQSRWTTVRDSELAKATDVEVLATSPQTGFHIAASRDDRFVFVTGHGEYDEETLDLEYRRDLAKGVGIDLPHRYYRADDPDQGIRMTWRSHGTLLFTNWLNYDVYQETPYDLEELPGKVVSKFGGSSLADARSFAAARDIIRADAGRRAVVVSAPGKRDGDDTKVTDELDLAQALARRRLGLEATMRQLRLALADTTADQDAAVDRVAGRFTEICAELGTSTGTKARVTDTIEQIRHSTDRDWVLSRGEYLTALIMAEYLGFGFVDAADLIFFAPDGSLDEERTTAAVRHTLDERDTVVVPGFYGRSAEGSIQVFERGGSDITGSILAAAMAATTYEKWTDVDGVMDADPRTHPDAERIEVLSYDELSAIAEGGAQVYHPRAVDAVARAGVPIRIMSTRSPDGGTTVSHGPAHP